jgi:hypothetical protein
MCSRLAYALLAVLAIVAIAAWYRHQNADSTLAAFHPARAGRRGSSAAGPWDLLTVVNGTQGLMGWVVVQADKPVVRPSVLPPGGMTPPGSIGPDGELIVMTGIDADWTHLDGINPLTSSVIGFVDGSLIVRPDLPAALQLTAPNTYTLSISDVPAPPPWASL